MATSCIHYQIIPILFILLTLHSGHSSNLTQSIHPLSLSHDVISYRRSLLPQGRLSYSSDLMFRINKSNTDISTRSILNVTIPKLKAYYNDIYNGSYNTSATTYSTADSLIVTFIMTLYTNIAVTTDDLADTNTFISTNISNDEYTVTLLGFVSSFTSGTVDDLFEELLIITFLLTATCLFCGVWIWKWYHRHVKGKGEVYFLDDYKEYRPNKENGDVTVIQNGKGQNEFATIDINEKSKTPADNEKSEQNGVEMVAVGKSEVIDSKSAVDLNVNDDDEEEDDDDVLEEHDEDDEKAEEIEYPNTTNNDGEDIIIEEDD